MPSPPVDPRLTWDLPPPGGLETVAVLDPLVTRVLADNPSPMTLDGTNTYLVGQGPLLVVDPGPDDPDHLRRVVAIVEGRDAEIAGIVVTHRHPDHAEAAQVWSETFGAPVYAVDPAVAGPGGVVLEHGASVPLPGTDGNVEVVATPGHTADHVVLRLPHGPVLTGDHVLGRGTSVVAHPDGDLEAYLGSLDRLLDLGPDTLYPGHGPALADGDPTSVIRYYQQHRRYRLEQILSVLAIQPATLGALVRTIYADVDQRLWPAAELSTRAAVEVLERRGHVGVQGGFITTLGS